MAFHAGQFVTAGEMNAELGVSSFLAGQKVRQSQLDPDPAFEAGDRVRAEDLNDVFGPPDGNGEEPPPPTGEVPGDVYDLSHWKITLPTGPSKDATEITQPELDSYEDAHFFLNTSNRMEFVAPVDGSTTSGSEATRCELRQMEPGGGTEIAWSPFDAEVHQLTVTLRADPTGASPRQEVIIGQIHGAGSSPIPLILSAEYHVSPPRVRVFQDGPGVGNLLEGEITTTTDFTFRIRYNGAEELEVSAAVGGASNLPGTPQFTFPASAFSDQTGWYFKHGAYNKSEVEAGGASGESRVQTSFIEVI